MWIGSGYSFVSFGCRWIGSGSQVVLMDGCGSIMDPHLSSSPALLPLMDQKWILSSSSLLLILCALIWFILTCLFSVLLSCPGCLLCILCWVGLMFSFKAFFLFWFLSSQKLLECLSGCFSTVPSTLDLCRTIFWSLGFLHLLHV